VSALLRVVPAAHRPVVLHYTGGTDDRGGIVSVVRALAATEHFDVVLGVSPGFRQERQPPLRICEFSAIEPERIGLSTILRARRVANEVRAWLAGGDDRIFHGHSRAGLLVALWLTLAGERRNFATVHCYGSQRWFYRWAARRLGDRLLWLTPAMSRYYGLDDGWERCAPGGVVLGGPPAERGRGADGRLRLGGAGFIVRWKRWDLVIDALAGLPAAIRNHVTFEHIGTIPDDADARRYAAELRVRADKLGVSHLVTWRGGEASSRRLLAEVDFIVVPSRREPYSMILQEGFGAGVPGLAADSGGPPDVIQPGVNGFCFEDGNAAALAALIIRILQERPDFDPVTIRKTARTAEAAAEKLVEVYRS
jgi:glycosyltransferase involved in cell wall biosynthesis